MMLKNVLYMTKQQIPKQFVLMVLLPYSINLLFLTKEAEQLLLSLLFLPVQHHLCDSVEALQPKHELCLVKRQSLARKVISDSSPNFCMIFN